MIKVPRFSATYNFGQLLTVGSIIGSMLGGAYYIGVTRTIMEGQIRTLDARVDAADLRAARYIPVIDSLQNSNNVQDNRIANLADGLKEQRQASNEILIQLGKVREDLAEVKAKVTR